MSIYTGMFKKNLYRGWNQWMSHQLLKAGLPGRPHNNYGNSNNNTG